MLKGQIFKERCQCLRCGIEFRLWRRALLPWPTRFHFRAWPMGMSVLAVTVDCDEKIGGRLIARRGASRVITLPTLVPVRFLAG